METNEAENNMQTFESQHSINKKSQRVKRRSEHIRTAGLLGFNIHIYRTGQQAGFGTTVDCSTKFQERQ